MIAHNKNRQVTLLFAAACVLVALIVGNLAQPAQSFAINIYKHRYPFYGGYGGGIGGGFGGGYGGIGIGGGYGRK